jgi:flagella basal body P-ring formation protein FlgA
MIARRLTFLLALLAAGVLRGAGADRTLYSSDKLLADLTTTLQEHLRCDGELQLDLLRPWVAPSRGASVWDFAVTEYPGITASNMLLTIRLKADGVVVVETSLLVHAVLMRDVWYTVDPVAAGVTFSPTLVVARRTDVLRQRDTLAAKDGDDSFIFSRELPADHLITWHDVGRRPLVHRGQVVDVRASEGQLLITMKALAMENGAKGDLVTVRNLETRKDIPAVVVGEQRVEVHF